MIKTYIKRFNSISSLLKATILTLPVYYLLDSFANYIANIEYLANKQPFLFIQTCSAKISQLTLLICILSMILLTIFLSLEIIDRIKNDSIKNMCLSTVQTLKTRRYMKRKLSKNSEKRHIDSSFNQVIKHLGVDLRKDRCCCFIPDSRNVLTDKEFETDMALLEKYIAKKNSSFYFSSMYNKAGGFWIEGSKK